MPGPPSPSEPTVMSSTSSGTQNVGRWASPVVAVGLSAISANPRIRLALRLAELLGALFLVGVTLPSGSRFALGLIGLIVGALAWLGWLAAGEHRRGVPAALALLSVAAGLSVAVHAEGIAFLVLATAVMAFSFSTLAAVAVGFAPAFVAFTVSALALGVFPGRLLALFAWGLVGVLLGFGRRQLLVRDREAGELSLAQRRTALADREARLANERNRLGREIHDVLAHTLSAVSIQLTALDARLASDDPPAVLRARVQGLHHLVSDGLEELQDAVRALRDDKLSLETQLARLCAMHGAEISVQGRTRGLAAEDVLTLYRVVQEALTNVEKHAPGAARRVALRYSDVTVSVDVDNGAGSGDASPLAGVGGGNGLAGMRARIALAEGTCSAGPEGEGWRVSATIPISPGAD